MPESGGVPTPASVFPHITPRAPERPVPDGRLIITTIHGTIHTYENRDMPKGWRPIGSGLQVSTANNGRLVWTWRNILNYEVIANSEDFIHAHRRWHAYNMAEAAKAESERLAGEEDDCVGVDGD